MLAVFHRSPARPTDGISLARSSGTAKARMLKGTLIGVVAVAGMALLSPAAFVSARQDPATATAPRVIEILAKRYSFEPPTIEVIEGERIRVLVRSGDGVHGMEIKRFKVNKLIPRGGKPIAIDFVASAPGTYEILCSEECGDGHQAMSGSLVVKARAK
jgi:cytochrome c oxidase subunit 2